MSFIRPGFDLNTEFKVDRKDEEAPSEIIDYTIRWFTREKSTLTDITHWLSERAGLVLNENELTQLKACSHSLYSLANIFDILSPSFLNHERLNWIIKRPEQLDNVSRLLSQIDRDCDTFYQVDLAVFFLDVMQCAPFAEQIIAQFPVRKYHSDPKLSPTQLRTIIDSFLDDKRNQFHFLLGFRPRLGANSSIDTFRKHPLFDRKTLPIISSFLYVKNQRKSFLYSGENFYEKAACEEAFIALESDPVNLTKIKALCIPEGPYESMYLPFNPAKTRRFDQLSIKFFNLVVNKIIQHPDNLIYQEVLALIINIFNKHSKNPVYRPNLPHPNNLRSVFLTLSSHINISHPLHEAIKRCKKLYLSIEMAEEKLHSVSSFTFLMTARTMPQHSTNLLDGDVVTKPNPHKRKIT